MAYKKNDYNKAARQEADKAQRGENKRAAIQDSEVAREVRRIQAIMADRRKARREQESIDWMTANWKGWK
jgi:hypothetical protein